MVKYHKHMFEILSGKKEVVMDFFGDEEVIRNILKKKNLLEKNVPCNEEIRTVLIAPGGGQRSVLQGAIGIGMKRAGVIDAFDAWIGVSSGAAAGYYTMAGEPEMGTEIFYKENVENRFVNFLRFGKIMDIDTLESVFRFKKPIDINKFKFTRSQLIIGLTNSFSGESEMLNIKETWDPVRAVVGSISYPILNGGKLSYVDGMSYTDGGIGNPLPITYAIEKLHATDILLAMTSPLEPRNSHPLLDSILAKTVYRHFTERVRNQILSINERYNRELEYLTGERCLPPGVRIAAIYPQVMPINRFTMDRNLLTQGAEAASEFTEKLFQKSGARML